MKNFEKSVDNKKKICYCKITEREQTKKSKIPSVEREERKMKVNKKYLGFDVAESHKKYYICRKLVDKNPAERTTELELWPSAVLPTDFVMGKRKDLWKFHKTGFGDEILLGFDDYADAVNTAREYHNNGWCLGVKGVLEYKKSKRNLGIKYPMSHILYVVIDDEGNILHIF